MKAESKSIEKFPLDPAERLDVIIDFSSLAGQTVTLKTEELTLAGDREIFKEDVMEFRVGEFPLKKKDRSVIPDILRPFEKIEESMATKTRRILFTDSMDLYGRLALTLNNLRYHHPATEMPEFDSMEIWEFANTVFNPDAPLGIPPNISHPIHLHLVQFQILNRQRIDVDKFNGEDWANGVPTEDFGEIIPIYESEKGWKDTVRVEPGTITRIIVHFKNYTGDYVWHCHILEHEDHDMMRPLRIIKKYND